MSVGAEDNINKSRSYLVKEKQYTLLLMRYRCKFIYLRVLLLFCVHMIFSSLVKQSNPMNLMNF